VPIPVVSLRRYPVKSMGGEALDSVLVNARGLLGDRWYAVEDDEGRFASAKNTRRFRRRDVVLEYAAATVGEHVEVRRGGALWTAGSPELDDELSNSCGTPVHVRPEDAIAHQDAGQVSLVGSATLAWCAERWGIDADPRRLRVNIVLETTEPFVEESWIGQRLGLGTATLRVAARVERCRTIDLAQDGTTATGRWLRPLADEREMRIAVYADVVTPGVIRLGDSLDDHLDDNRELR
jgi:uncharacterized protein YcbX